MEKQMTQEEIKRKLADKLRKRKEDNLELVCLTDQIEPHVNKYLGDSFPHEYSFDELLYSENNWIDELIENLERVQVLKKYIGLFYNSPTDEEIAFTREIKAWALIEASKEAYKIAKETGTYYGVKESKEE